MDEATRILPKPCPALSWDQALLSLSWVKRFPAGKANPKVCHLVKYLCTCIEPELSNVINVMIVSSLTCVFTWLPWHQTDLKLNTRASMATYHAYLLVQHGHPQNVDRSGKILAIQLIKHHWPRLVCALLLLPTISVWVYFLMSFPLDGHVL